jgi:hypothetical protein
LALKYAKTEFVYIQGKVSWFKPFMTNKWNKYSTQIHPTPEGLEKIRELQAEGLKNQIKKDDDGYYTTFTRPVSKEFRSGKIITFAPVEVFDKDGKPFDQPVGNGTDATLKIEVYEHETPGGGKAKAARWVSARIDNLIPFVPDKDYTEEQKASAEGLKEQPQQLF